MVLVQYMRWACRDTMTAVLLGVMMLRLPKLRLLKLLKALLKTSRLIPLKKILPIVLG